MNVSAEMNVNPDAFVVTYSSIKVFSANNEEHYFCEKFLSKPQNPKWGDHHLFDRDRLEHAGYMFRTNNGANQWLQVDISEKRLLRYFCLNSSSKPYLIYN